MLQKDNAVLIIILTVNYLFRLKEVSVYGFESECGYILVDRSVL